MSRLKPEIEHAIAHVDRPPDLSREQLEWPELGFPTARAGHILISDVEHEPFRIRYRLVGTRAREATGFNIMGRYLDELLPADPDEPWMDDYRLAYRTRRPVLGVSSIKTTSGGVFTYEYGLFPLRKGGATIEQFVAIEDYEDLSSTLMDLVEWRERPPK